MPYKAHKKCKFFQICPLFYPESYTCQNYGGVYCGKYRSLSRISHHLKISIVGGLKEIA